jgi:AMP-binding enzyme
MLSREPTAYDDKIYSADWRAFADPELPETIAPTAILLDRHLGTPVEHKAAIIVDGEPVSYGALARRVAEVSAGLCAIGVVPENRILLFGTDSLDYVTMWLGAVRIGAVPAVVSDLYKAPELLYSSATPRRGASSSTPSRRESSPRSQRRCRHRSRPSSCAEMPGSRRSSRAERSSHSQRLRSPRRPRSRPAHAIPMT